MIHVALHGSASSHARSSQIAADLTSASARLLRSLALHPDTELSIVLTDDEEMRALNLQWNGYDRSTDVLSFPQFEPDAIPSGPCAIGDIVISLPYAETTLADARHKERIEASLGNKVDEWTFDDELKFLLIHGLLHLVGYDHFDADTEAEMRAKEKELWFATND